MLTKIKNYTSYVIHNITDLRVLGQIVFGILALLVSWSCVQAIQTNADLQKQISKIEQENDVHQLANENLKLKTQFLNTDRYLELAARRQFGKAAAGEKVLIVPKNVAIAHTIDIQAVQKKVVPKTEPHQPFYEHNLEAWRNFFFHRDD